MDPQYHYMIKTTFTNITLIYTHVVLIKHWSYNIIYLPFLIVSLEIDKNSKPVKALLSSIYVCKSIKMRSRIN